ncbi:reverse transcriptase domain-containing protein [Tanacetum coccineum]
MLRACPHHGFTELTQVDTFYNGLNENDQDSLNAAAGGNLLSKTTREALNIIENKSKVRYSRNKSNVSRMNTTSRESVSKTDERIDKLADQLSTLVEIVSKKVVTPAPVKAVEEICVTCSGPHAWYNCPNTDNNQSSVCAATVERETEETTDKEQSNFQGSTSHIPPPVNSIPIPKPDVPKTLPKPNIPYPSRRNDQKSRDKASNQMENIFQDLHFDISFADALLLMPRFAPTIKSLLRNKEKLLELAKIPLNENCSAMLLKKLPEKLGDPGKFLILCNFPGMDICHALADLDLKRPRVPLILGRSFLRTGRALIDVYGEELTLRVDNEAITFNLDQTTRYYSTNDKSVNRIDIIDELKDLPSRLEYAYLEGNDKLPVIIAKGLKDVEKEALLKDDYKPTVQSQRRVNPKIHEVIKKEVLQLLDAGMIYPIFDSLWVSPVHCVPKKGGITVVANEKNELIPTHGFLGYFQIPIDLQDQEKTTFTCPYGTFAYRRMPFGLCNAPDTFQRCMMAIFHDMIEKTMEVFMDDFSVFGDNFDLCLSNLEKMLKRCEDTNLVLNWEKCHFMCREGIVLGHKILKSGIEVDHAKIDVIAKLPHPTTVKGVRSFLGHAGFY